MGAFRSKLAMVVGYGPLKDDRDPWRVQSAFIVNGQQLGTIERGHGSFTPCADPPCPNCIAQSPWRWRALSPSGGAVGVFATRDEAGDALRA